MARKTKQSVDISGCNNYNVGNHHETTNLYSGMSRDDLIAMMEERFHHMLEKEAKIVEKEAQVKEIFEENRKLTDELILQNAEFRTYNAAYRRQAEKIAELTDKLIEKKI